VLHTPRSRSVVANLLHCVCNYLHAPLCTKLAVHGFHNYYDSRTPNVGFAFSHFVDIKARKCNGRIKGYGRHIRFAFLEATGIRTCLQEAPPDLTGEVIFPNVRAREIAKRITTTRRAARPTTEIVFYPLGFFSQSSVNFGRRAEYPLDYPHPLGNLQAVF
jgi:hypothetical protein